MPSLLKTIQRYDLGFLRILAGYWGLPAPAEATEQARNSLADGMLNPALAREMAAALPPEAAAALNDLLRDAGRIPWMRLTHTYGPLRQLGPARRERERPQDHPASGLESLYYRGLLARAFFDTPEGPQEFGFIPDDLLAMLPPAHPAPERIPGRPARETETSHPIPANDQLLDDLTTLLAALRSGRLPEAGLETAREGFCRMLLRSMEILREDASLDVDRTRRFLEAPRGEALARIAGAWLGSPVVDELALVPEFEIAAEIPREPVRLRARVLAAIDTLPKRTWWSLGAFTAGIESLEPEFLRPAGELDSRYLKDRATGEFLEAGAGWEAVEGVFLRWLIAGPLHWLGLVDLAAGGKDREADHPPPAFRLSRWSTALRAGKAPDGLADEDAKIHVRSDGRISVPRLAPRSARYLVARFCDWETPVRDEYRYRASPRSLQRAGDDGLRVGQLIALLARHAEAIPPNITKALKSWERHGQAARIETAPILRLPSPEALEELRRSRASRYLGDALGPAVVALKPGTEARVLAALNELGYLAEIVDPKP